MESRRKKTKQLNDKSNPLAWVPAEKLSQDLIDAFQALEEAGFRFTAYKTLYLNTIEQSSYAYNLSRCFNALNNSGLHGNRHKTLYLNLIDNAANAYQLAAAFRDLKNAGLHGVEHKELYIELLKKAQFAYVTASAFRALTEAKLYGRKYKDLYLRIIAHANADAHNLAWAAQTLTQIGLTGEQHKELYLKIISLEPPLHILAPALLHLKKLGFSVHDDFDLFLKVTDQAIISNKLVQAFEELKIAGFSWSQHKDVYLEVITESASFPKTAYMIVAALQRLNGMEFPNDCNKDLFLAAIRAPYAIDELVNDPDKNDYAWLMMNNNTHIKKAQSINADLVGFILAELKQSGLSPKEYFYVYIEILNQINQGNSITAIKLLNTVCDTIKNQPSKSNKRDLECIIENTLAPKIHYGPLVKTAATYTFEDLLIRVAQVDNPSMIRVDFDKDNGYTVTLPNEAPVNVTLLLHYANLSHLALSNDTIEELDRMIRQISPTYNDDNDYNEEADLNTLTQASKRAIHYYTTERYKNINRILRGEELTDKSHHGWIDPVHSSQSYLANFICGCLVNDAANKLEPLRSKNTNNNPYQIAAYPGAEPIDPELSRGEKVSQELKKRRLSNVLRAPSITSFSHFKGGSDYFHSPGTTHTKLKGHFTHYPVINSDEGEIIFSHGEQIEYHSSPNGGFFAKLIRSPDHQKSEGYIAGLALQHAYEQHLKKPYKESTNSTTVNGKNIERPNHGLAHTYRVMMNVTHVINYFSVHAIDQDFKQFCADISETERNLLSAAAAFSITGRESEIAAGEDLARYDSYRKASAEHLNNFLGKHIPYEFQPQKMKQGLLHIVRYMGNPWYEKDSPNGDIQKINSHEDLQERKHRNHLHRILTIAHKLDLPRCYDQDEFEASMTMLRELSDETLDTKQNIARSDYLKLIQYTIELTKAHGNMLQFDVTADGTYIHKSIGYKPPFDEASTSLKRLYEISETVPLSIVTFNPKDDYKRMRID